MRRPSQERIRRTRRAVVVAAVSALVLAGFSPGAAYAHTELVASEPSPRAQLESPPTRVVLTFNAELEPAFASAALVQGSSKPRALTPNVDGVRLVAEVRPTTSPTAASADAVPWTLVYRVVSVDGHPISGQVAFSVLPTSEPAPAQDGSSAATTPASAPPDAALAVPEAAPAVPLTAPTAAPASGASTRPLPWRSMAALGLLTVVLLSALTIAARTRRSTPEARRSTVEA